jgi:PKD domain
MKNCLTALFALTLVACGGGGGNTSDNPGTSAPAPSPTTAPAPTPANSTPVANAGLAQSVVAGAAITLDASNSSDADKDVLTYEWTWVSKPSDSAAVLSSGTIAKPTFTADVEGTYTLSLVASDGKTRSNPSTVTITASSAQTQATCAAYLATNPNPSGIRAVTGPGVTQRNALLASGGKLVAIGSRYYAVSIPAAFYTAANAAVVFELPGTGGYPEAGWNDWNASMAERGHAFISLYWGGGTPEAATDTEIYAALKQISQEVGAACPITRKSKWLMGFSVGSAYSFAVMIRDVADKKMFRGQLALSGAAIGPLTTGKDVMHPTVESNRSNANAVLGTKSWMYCGDKDFDHGWSMCTEMPNGESFVNTHGGNATLYRDPNGTHNSLPANVAGRNQMFDHMAQ